MSHKTIPADEILKQIHTIGQYYGFKPLSDIMATNRGVVRAKTALPKTFDKIALDPAAETIIRLLKKCRRLDPPPTVQKPLFIWHTNIAPGRPAQKKATIQFHSLGSTRAIANTVIIRALVALIRDLYKEDPVLRINSMGDKETRARYIRELGVFFKKHSHSAPCECIDLAKNDIFSAAEFAISHEYTSDLPVSSNHLSDASRRRFEDLLEYLEMTETSYELAPHLISRDNVWNDICFEMTVGGQRVAWGSQYNNLTQHFFPDAPMNATGAVLQITTDGAITKNPITPKLRFSFVHIGDEAKRASIRLAEDLRKSHVPLVQHIGIESLSEQLSLVERNDSPYLIIMGRKEAIEHSVILRDRATRVEIILPIEGIVDRLQTMK